MKTLLILALALPITAMSSDHGDAGDLLARLPFPILQQGSLRVSLQNQILSRLLEILKNTC